MTKTNQNKDTQITNNSRVYIFAAVLMAVVTLFNMFLVNRLHDTNQTVMDNTIGSIQAVSTMNDELSIVNRNVLMIVAGTGDPETLVPEIANSFRKIERAEIDYAELTGHSEMELRRYNQAIIFKNAYRDKIVTYQDKFTTLDAEDARNTYIQEIHPLQVTASEMLLAAIDLGKKAMQSEIDRNERTYYTVEIIMAALLLIAEIGIFIVARIAKKQRLALERRAQMLEEIDSKLQTSRQKVGEIALTNILTGMKNRYALDADLSERLEKDQFNIAVFDLDNFRSINDMYGYDFGDEYLAQVAEKLKTEYSEVAEIYNITGNEFCFVFNRDIPDAQAQRTVERIHATMTEYYNIFNIGSQLTASGSTYHYLPGDCLNVASLLVKMDNVMREAKRNGGNAVYPVMGI